MIRPEFPDLLLGDRLAPMTTEIGFLETDYRAAAEVYLAWSRKIHEPRGVTLVERPIVGDLETALRALLPLTSVEDRRYLFAPTASGWTAYFDSGHLGTDVQARIPVLAGTLGCRGLRMVADPVMVGNRRRAPCAWGAIMLSLYDPESVEVSPPPGVKVTISVVVDGERREYDGSNPEAHRWLPSTEPVVIQLAGEERVIRSGRTARGIEASDDGGRWVFDAYGTPLPFERPEFYGARRVRDRFPFELLREYLLALGVDAFNAEWYLPDGVATLVERVGPRVPGSQDFMLEEVQAR